MIFAVGSIFFTERLVVGQWQILFAYGILFWVVYIAFFLNLNIYKKSIIGIILLLGSIYYYHRFINAVEIALFAAAISWLIYGKKPRRLSCRFAIVIPLALMMVYAIRYFGGTYGVSINDTGYVSQLSLFSLGEGNPLQRLSGAISYIGFWAERAGRMPINYSHWLFWYVPGIILFISGIYSLKYLYRKNQPLSLFLAITYLLGLAVTILNSDIISSNLIIRINNFFGLSGLRETGKFMGLMMIPHTIALGYFFESFFNDSKNQISKLIGYLSIFSITVIFTSAIFINSVMLKPIKIPQGLIDFANNSNQNGDKVILLPWHRFQGYSFSEGKAIDQLGQTLFINSVFNDMFEYGGILTTSSDSWQIAMANSTYGDKIQDGFIELLKEKDINKLVIIKTNDYQKYIDFANEKQLLKITDNIDFISYQLN